jgi:AcrR family transcriptional regulator
MIKTAMDDVKRLTRRERARRTRAAIVRAATEEFRARGYHGATMAAIAQRAGVAVQTVYFVFGTKPALLTATIDDAVMGESDPVPPARTEWWREGTSTADGGRAIRLFATNVAAILERSAALDRVAAAASATDPEIVDLVRHHDSMRAHSYRDYMDSLASRGLLRADRDVSEATDVLLTLVGSNVFLDFTEGRGWSRQHYVDWASETLCTLLLEPIVRA